MLQILSNYLNTYQTSLGQVLFQHPDQMETLPLPAEVEVGFLYENVFISVYIYIYYNIMYMQEMPPAPEPEQRQPGDHRQAFQECFLIWSISDSLLLSWLMQESKPLLCGIASIDASLEARRFCVYMVVGWGWRFSEPFLCHNIIYSTGHLPPVPRTKSRACAILTPAMIQTWSKHRPKWLTAYMKLAARAWHESSLIQIYNILIYAFMFAFLRWRMPFAKGPGESSQMPKVRLRLHPSQRVRDGDEVGKQKKML